MKATKQNSCGTVLFAEQSCSNFLVGKGNSTVITKATEQCIANPCEMNSQSSANS